MPPTLHASLMARLDRLGSAASSGSGCWPVTDLPEPQLHVALGQHNEPAVRPSGPRSGLQAWLALHGAEDKDFSRRLRKGTGADPTADGATRVAGSFNFKHKYAPAFPRVAIYQANSGRMTSAAELERLGLVAAPEAAHRCASPLPRHASQRPEMVEL